MADTDSELDFSGKEQLYSQLFDILFQGIVGGAYKVGDLIPSESELMRQYGVSRATARKAMEMLSNKGLISKQRGKGSIVVSNVPSGALSRVTSYMKKSMDDKATPHKRLVESIIVPCPEDVAHDMQLEVGTEMFMLSRVRYSAETPYYLEVNYYEQAFLPRAIERDFSKESIRAYILSIYPEPWSRATQAVYARRASAELADLLNISEGDPVLYIKRYSFDQQNRARECVKTYYRADLYHVEVELGE